MNPTRAHKIANAVSQLQDRGEPVTVRSVHKIVRGRFDAIAAVLRAIRESPSPQSGRSHGPSGRAVSRPSGRANPSGASVPQGSGTARDQELPLILSLEKTAGLLRSLSALGAAAQRSNARTALARELTSLCIHYGLISPTNSCSDDDGSQGRTDSSGRPITQISVGPGSDIPVGCDGRGSEIPVVVLDHGATAIPAAGSTDGKGATEKQSERVNAAS